MLSILGWGHQVHPQDNSNCHIEQKGGRKIFAEKEVGALAAGRKADVASAGLLLPQLLNLAMQGEVQNVSSTAGELLTGVSSREV